MTVIRIFRNGSATFMFRCYWQLTRVSDWVVPYISAVDLMSVLTVAISYVLSSLPCACIIYCINLLHISNVISRSLSFSYAVLSQWTGLILVATRLDNLFLKWLWFFSSTQYTGSQVRMRFLFNWYHFAAWRKRRGKILFHSSFSMPIEKFNVCQFVSL